MTMTMTTRLSRAEILKADLSLLSESLQRYYRIGMEAKALSDDKEASRKLAAKYSKRYKVKSKSDHRLKARRFVQRLSNRKCLKLFDWSSVGGRPVRSKDTRRNMFVIRPATQIQRVARLQLSDRIRERSPRLRFGTCVRIVPAHCDEVHRRRVTP